MSLNILAYDWLLVVAGHVVPPDPVPVVVVQHGHAGLGLPVELDLLPIVGLSARWSKPASGGPIVEPGAVGRWHGDLVCRPEPAVDVLGKQVGPVATIEVTETAGCPEVWHARINESLDVVVLLLGLEGHEVHAALPAVVPGVEPAPLGVLGAEVRVQPAEVVVVTTKTVDPSLVHPVLAELSVRKAQLAGTLVGITTTITREELVLSC